MRAGWEFPAAFGYASVSVYINIIFIYMCVYVIRRFVCLMTVGMYVSEYVSVSSSNSKY